MMPSPEQIRQAQDRLLRAERRRDALIARLSADDYPYLEAVMREWERTGLPLFGPSLPQLILAFQDYERFPVSVDQFIEDERYLGTTLRGQVFPKLKADLCEFFEGDYTMAVVTGGIGCGKSFWAEIAFLYELYRVSCLQDPAVTFGLRSGSHIAFINVSVTIAQARKVFFDGLGSLLQESPYFQNEFPCDKRQKSMLQFPKGIRLYPATASPQGVLGEGIFSAVIDEANYMEVIDRSRRTFPGEGATYDQAEATLNKLIGRITSRWNQKGRIPGHIYVISSARYPNDLTERLEKLAASPEGGHIFFRRHTSWGTRPATFYMGGTFPVEIGDVTKRSRVLDGGEANVNRDRVIQVPKDYESRFRSDTETAVRDFVGESTLSIRPFISRREKIHTMFELGAAAGLRHPFTHLDVTLQQEDPELERLLPEHLHWIEWTPDRYEQPTREVNGKKLMLFPALYHAHVDLSKSGDATGLVIAHNIGARKIRRFDARSMQEVEELKPIIRVDLALRIVPPGKGEEIDIPRIRAILYQLNRVYKMQFGKITFDTYGSQESVKTMKDEGFNADILSVDTDTTPYETLRTAIYAGNIFCYHVPMLERELIQLERGPKKIDHPPHGSKDLADALAGAVTHCEETWRVGESSLGLFQIGLVEYQGEASPERQKSLEDIHTKITAGQTLTDREENKLLFGWLEPL